MHDFRRWSSRRFGERSVDLQTEIACHCVSLPATALCNSAGRKQSSRSRPFANARHSRRRIELRGRAAEGDRHHRVRAAHRPVISSSARSLRWPARMRQLPPTPLQARRAVAQAGRARPGTRPDHRCGTCAPTALAPMSKTFVQRLHKHSSRLPTPHGDDVFEATD
jgi:hypothetical protein